MKIACCESADVINQFDPVAAACGDHRRQCRRSDKSTFAARACRRRSPLCSSIHGGGSCCVGTGRPLCSAPAFAGRSFSSPTSARGWARRLARWASRRRCSRHSPVFMGRWPRPFAVREPAWAATMTVMILMPDGQSYARICPALRERHEKNRGGRRGIDFAFDLLRHVQSVRDAPGRSDRRG